MDIEEIIRRAKSEGYFNDLPGKGKPLDLSKRQPQDAVGGLLKEAGFVPEWATLGKELDASAETTKRRIAQWLRRREILLKEAETRLERGAEGDARRILRQANEDRDSLARELTVRWVRDRRRTERFNLLVPSAHQQRGLPVPERLLKEFLDASPDACLPAEGAASIAHCPAVTDIPALLEAASEAVEKEEGGRRSVSSERAEAVIGFKARYGGGR